MRFRNNDQRISLKRDAPNTSDRSSGQTHARSMKFMATAMKTYEAMFLLPPAAATEQEKSLQLVRGIVERHSGKILVIKKWDERKLAYEMNGQKRGLYIIVYFTAPGPAVTAIE